MTNTSAHDKIISVFGSHSPIPGSQDYELAKETGKRLAEAGYSVATGGYEGMMAGVSQGAAEAGGHVIGVSSRQVERTRSTTLNIWVKEEIRYDSLVDRIVHLVSQNSGMIVLPGGIGTLSELALGWNLLQVNELSARPLITIGSMWQETIKAFMRPEYTLMSHLGLILQATTPKEAIEKLERSLQRTTSKTK